MEKKNHGKPYEKLVLMQVLGFVVMYGVMFLNVDQANHIYLSLTRTYMTLLMVAPMALIMLGLMAHMYPNKRRNAAIVVAAVLVFAGALAGLRTQTPIGEVQWMKAMIPHHSSAIMVSQRADIQDPEARALAEQIIKSQKEEIAQMKAMVERMK